jgi:hypothetical protein
MFDLPETASPLLGGGGSDEYQPYTPPGGPAAPIAPTAIAVPTSTEDTYTNPFAPSLLAPLQIEEDYRAATERVAQNAMSGLVDPELISQVMADTWLEIERGYAVDRATTDTMIQLALDEAALPYDQKLLLLDRDIADVRGKMDDLDRITDYYKANIVDTWEKAAAAGRATSGNDIRQQIAPRIAAIGKIYDLSNGNTQAYLDRIGGVPMAQRVAINDAIHELRSPYEGLSEVEGTFAARIVDAQGLLFEKQADRGLTAANLEAETNRFVIGAGLNDALEEMELARQDEIGFRARAMKNAKMRAAEDYKATNQLPDRQTFAQNALYGMMSEMGVDPLDQQGYMQSFEGLLYEGLGVFGFQNIQISAEGEEYDAGWPPIRTLADLESALSSVPVELQDDDDFRVLLNMMNAYERQAQEYTAMERRVNERREAGTGGRGKGSQAPDNIANRNHPSYVARANMADEFGGLIGSQFDVKVWGQYRDLDAEVTGAMDPNSDHYSGGALDIWPTTSGGKDEVDRLAAALLSWPEVSFVRWNEPGHYDHLHVSFLLPEDIGGGGYVDSVLPDPVSSQDSPVVSGVNQTTRDALAEYLGRGQ